MQGGVCLTRGMKVLLRVGQSEWGEGTPARGLGKFRWYMQIWGSSFSPSLTSFPSSGPRGGAVPRKPVSEMPMERDRGAAHSVEPGRDSIPGRNQEPGTASSAPRPQLPCLHPLLPSLSRFGGGDTGKRREDGRVGGKWKPNEEKTQLELISQVTASISAVKEVGGLHGRELEAGHLDFHPSLGEGMWGT